MEFDLWKYYEKNKRWLIYVILIYAILNIVGLFLNLYRTEVIASRSSKTDQIIQQNTEIMQILNKTLGNSTCMQTCKP